MIRLTRQEMLVEWKRRKGLMPVSTSAMQVARRGSDTVDEMLLGEIDDWYARVLLTAPVELLPVRDMAGEVEVTDLGDGSVEVEMPGHCVRPVTVKMSGWRAPARIVEEADGALARLQTSRYVSGKTYSPVAVKRGRRLTLYSRPDNGKLTELRCVAPPADGSYELDRSLLPDFYNL